MSNDSKIADVVIYSIERTQNSHYGNPGYKLHTSQGTFSMQTDAALGYSIDNYTNSRFPETYVIGNPDNPTVTLLVTASRKVYGIEYNGKILS